jgi:DNA-binding protein HU-beta
VSRSLETVALLQHFRARDESSKADESVEEDNSPIAWVFPPTQGLGYRRHEMIRTYGENMAAKLMTKSELIQKIAEKHGESITRKDVKGVIESLAEIGYKELKKTGAFVVPGFAKFVVVKKPATKARKGINPFTKEPTVFKAKPARKIIKARPVKATKDAVG